MLGQHQTRRYLQASGENVCVNQLPKIVAAQRAHPHVRDLALGVQQHGRWQHETAEATEDL